MYRTELLDDKGMLFIFKQPGTYSFWMKNVKIPIDMIWVDSGRKIVHIEHNVPPCKADPCPLYNPGKQALYVVETAPGFAEKHDIDINDIIIIITDQNKEKSAFLDSNVI
jgi:hypothetical protein